MIEQVSAACFGETGNNVWQRLRIYLSSKYQFIEQSTNSVSFITLMANETYKQKKIEYAIKANKDSIILTASVIGRLLQKKQHQIKRLNKQFFQGDSIFWFEQNQNFGARKVIPMQSFGLSEIAMHQFLKTQIQKIECLLNYSLELSTEQQKNLVQKQGHQTRLSILRKLNTLQQLKFQLEVNRRKRQKSTSMDFNFCKIKSISEMISLKQACAKQSKNYMQLLRENRIKNQINATLASESFNKMLQKMKKKQNQNEVKKVLNQSQKILTPIKMHFCKMVDNNQKLEGTFSHIEVVQSEFAVIYSLNLKTAEIISKQKASNKQIKSKNCVLVRKKKCQGCNSQYANHQKINEAIFQNQKQILMILNPYCHDSICNFYIESYAKKNDINSIYSKKLPSDPISRFNQTNNIRNPLKYIRKILKFCTQVVQGVRFLSNLHILHRDLKPTNIMLDERDSAKIIDFGSSCPVFGSSLESYLSQDFDYKLRSTKGYYFKYAELPSEVSAKYSKQQYNRHQSFDVFSLGSIIEFFMPNTIGLDSKNYQHLQDHIEYLTKKCKDIHPDDRLTPTQATIYLKQLTALATLMLNDI